MAAAEREAPRTAQEAAEALRGAANDERPLRLRGSATKLGWGAPVQAHSELSSEKLTAVREHNTGDLTAVLEAGVRLADAQATFAEADQMLALDPPLGDGDQATIGGVVATGDSGPLRHRYGGPRDLLLGITVALADGSIATAGGKVIKNVAGYDLSKLFAGSFGTLGLIVEVVVRLHPRPESKVTAIGESDDPMELQKATLSLSHAPLELEALDVWWKSGRGAVLARIAGAAPEHRARTAARAMEEAGVEARIEEDDEELWRGQRQTQRSTEGVVVRVSALQSQLARVVHAAESADGHVVSRAGLGVSWVRLEDRDEESLVASIDELRSAVQGVDCVVLDAPLDVREKVDVWGEPDQGALSLMRRVKARFDPTGVCNPGIYVGGI